MDSDVGTYASTEENDVLLITDQQSKRGCMSHSVLLRRDQVIHSSKQHSQRWMFGELPGSSRKRSINLPLSLCPRDGLSVEG
jgi:hypothetical protein